MRYNVVALLKAPTGESRTVHLDTPIDLDADGLHATGPVRGSVTLMREPGGILALGTLCVAARMECIRCLAPVDVEIGFDLEESFRPTVAVPGGPPPSGADADEDEATRIDDLHVVDLREVVRQAVLLAAPVRPLCAPDCRGLCPRCGADLNTDACGCQTEPDPRWAGLRHLIDGGQ